MMASTLFFCSGFADLSAAQKSSAVENDMGYYRRVAEKNAMGPNDRLYILYRLRQKYDPSLDNTQQLEKEILFWENERIKPISRQAALSKTQPSPPPVPSPFLSHLTHIRIADNGDGALTLFLDLTNDVIPKAVRVVNTQNNSYPKLIIDLPRTEAALPVEEREKQWTVGPLVSLVVAVTEKNVVRVSFEMRGDPAYRVVRRNKDIFSNE
jgi:hypothetical protein